MSIASNASITDAYAVAGDIVAAVEGPEVARVNARSAAAISVLGAGAIDWLREAARSPFRVSDDRQRLEWPNSGQSLGVAELLDGQKAAFYFIRWNPSSVRREMSAEELSGCWRNAGGYALLEADGRARVKMVGKSAADLEGSWRWEYRGPQEFRRFRQADAAGAPTEGPTHTFRVTAYDGNAIILAAVTPIKIGNSERTVEAPAVWWRAKRPKSWQ